VKIIAGKFKGRNIDAGKSMEIRPTLARVRKSFFDMLAPYIEAAEVLDLFAGAGTLGIEALSRGARTAVFADCSTSAIDLIKENLSTCQAEKSAQVYKIRLPENLGTIRGIFDIVFLDPPYNEDLADPTLNCLARSALLTEEAMILAQVGKKEELKECYGDLVLLTEKRYGDTKMYLYRKKKELK
jgi:16S rRNA (guanine966-N2)-methyltransferase